MLLIEKSEEKKNKNNKRTTTLELNKSQVPTKDSYKKLLNFAAYKN